MIRVVVADDQALVRDGLVAILDAQDDIEVVAQAADGREAVERCDAVDPDVVVMDIRMPHVDGIEATRLLARRPRPRVLILTTFDLDEYVYEALKAGASGFLLKDVPRQRMIEGVRVVASGDTLLAPHVTRRLIEEFVRRPRRHADIPAEMRDLSKRELDVYGLVAEGLSNAEIATSLYLSEATVKTHMAHILTKLGLRDRVQAVVLAYETGLVQPKGTSP